MYIIRTMQVTYMSRIDKFIIAASCLMSFDIVFELVIAHLALSVFPDSLAFLDSLDSIRALIYSSCLVATTVWFFRPVRLQK